MTVTTAAPARCPRCKHLLDDLIVDQGRLLTAGRRLPIVAFYCPQCRRTIHWDWRGEQTKVVQR